MHEYFESYKQEQINKLKNLLNNEQKFCRLEVVYNKKYNRRHMMLFVDPASLLLKYKCKNLINRLNKKRNKHNKIFTRQEYNTVRVYFDDPLEEFILNFPDDLKKSLMLIETVPPILLHNTNRQVSQHTAESKVRVVFKKTKPKWLYRVHVSYKFSRNLRRRTDSNFNAIAEIINETSKTKYLNEQLWSNYFYAENLDWLSMALLIDSKFIRSIEEFRSLQNLTDQFEKERKNDPITV